jgi:putative ABC transport system permease protein
VAQVPGVEAVALDIYGPFSGARMLGRIRQVDAIETETIEADMKQVTPGWFELLSVDVVSGRTFRAEDWEPGAPARLVFTAQLANRLFGTADVTGRRLTAGFGAQVEAEIVGVVEDIRLLSPGDDPLETFFQPYGPSGISFVTVLARARSLDGATLAGITEAVERAVPQLPVPAASRLEEQLDARLAEQRLFSRTIGLVAALSALLAAVGLYGLIAFAVAGRRRELGIRLALGADGRALAGLVGRYALGIVGIGTAAGLAGAYGLSQVLESRLFGITAADPTSYVATSLLFAVVAALACWVPTRAAMRVDPVGSLRTE